MHINILSRLTARSQCDGKWEVWAGSADWMPRNFDSRVEIFFPILNEQIKNRVLQNVLMKQTAVRNPLCLVLYVCSVLCVVCVMC